MNQGKKHSKTLDNSQWILIAFSIDVIVRVCLVSMLGPSPDWIVGVSALEMCQLNCTWIDNKVHTLYVQYLIVLEIYLYPWGIKCTVYNCTEKLPLPRDIKCILTVNDNF